MTVEATAGNDTQQSYTIAKAKGYPIPILSDSCTILFRVIAQSIKIRNW
jgi:hypothetical protein